MGIRVALGREQIADIFKQFCILLLMAGFFLACINNYGEWSWKLIRGLQKIAGELGSSSISSDSPFKAGLEIVSMILNEISAWSPMDSLAMVITAGVIFCCFVLISAKMIIIKCEAMVSMMAALILVSFGASSFVKDYAVNVLKYVLSVALKLFVMQLVIGVGITFIEKFTVGGGVEYQDLFAILGASIILIVLVSNLPDVVAGIISGSHIGSGAGLGAAASSVVGAVSGGVAGIAGGMSASSSASKLADLQGKTGVGKLASMAGSLYSAHQESKSPGEKSISTRTSEAMKERLEQAKLNNN